LGYLLEEVNDEALLMHDKYVKNLDMSLDAPLELPGGQPCAVNGS